MSERFSRAESVFTAFIALVLAGGVLKLTAPVVIPFTIAVLLAFVMEPLVDALERLRIPRAAAILLAVLFIGGGLLLAAYTIFESGRTIASLYPKYERKFTVVYGWAAGALGLGYDERLSFFQNVWGQLGVRDAARDMTITLSNGLLAFAKDAVMVLLFVVFLLLESAHIKQKVDLAFEGRKAKRIKKIGADVVRQVSRYLSVKFFVSLATGAVVALALALLGMDLPLVWGLVSFILNFIPNIGSIAASLGVGVFALVQFWPEPGPILGAGAIMLGANMAIGNILEPKIQGDNLGLSPFVVVVSLLAWGWLWGFPGLVLAVPMTVIVKILCESVDELEPAAIMLGSYAEAQKRKKAKQDEREERKAEKKPDAGDTGPDAL